jgi:hypothetical protein
MQKLSEFPFLKIMTKFEQNNLTTSGQDIYLFSSDWKAFIGWMQGIQKAAGSVAARGSSRRLSAWLSTNRMMPGRRKVDDKSNEMTVFL